MGMEMKGTRGRDEVEAEVEVGGSQKPKIPSSSSTFD
jgi:hypothetical protein